MPRIEHITTVENLIKSREAVLSSASLGCDTETMNNRGDKEKAFDPHKHEIRLFQVSPNRDISFVYDLGELNSKLPEFDFLRDTLANPKVAKTFHNAKFDLRFLDLHFGAHHFESVFDTMLGSQLINSGEDAIRNSLADCVQRFCGKRIDKTQQKSDFSGSLSDDQIRYSGIDAIELHDLREAQTRVMRSLDLLRVAQIEFDAVESIAMTENAGFFLDGEQWIKQAEKEEKKKAALVEKLHEAFKEVCESNLFGEVSINLDSMDEVNDALRKLGVPVEDGKTRAWQLKPLAEKHPILKDVMAYRESAPATKTFGRQFPIDWIHPLTGRIHQSLKQIGAPTGRMSASDPNLMQIPSENAYRTCFKAQGEDSTLVIADYSMIELRLLGEFSRDEKLMKAFNEGIDLHSFTASLVFKKTLEECGKGTKMRRLGKDLNFGTVYDISAWRFGMNTSQTEEEAGKQLKAFFTMYCQLDSYLKDAAQQAIDQRECRTWSGRTHRLEFDDKDLKARSAAGRNGRNTAIQGSGADILKRALYLFRNRVRGITDAKQVNIVHDEIVAECKKTDAEIVARHLECAMIEAGEEVMRFVPCVVEAEIQSDWRKDNSCLRCNKHRAECKCEKGYK